MKKILLSVFTLCLCVSGFAQTFLVTPTFSGGFENGASFGVNNWTAVNGPANQWALGTGTINIGARSAYIGDATTYFGTNTAATNHFYRNNPGVIIPAGATNVYFSFRYRQPVTDPGDSLIVSITSTLTPTPVAGATPSPLHVRLYQNSSVAHPGFQEIGPFDLTAYAGSSVRIVFTHVNDGTAPIGIPAVDSISVAYCPAGTVSGANSICQGATTVYTVSAGVGAGAWSSSNPAVATATGTATTTTVSGVSAGTATISFTSGTCFWTRMITINATPGASTGAMSVCVANTTTLSNAMGGGAWTSSATGIATVGGTGIVSGVAPGTANISYSMPSGCRTISTVTVNANPTVFNVTGGGSFCASGSGVPVGLNNSTTGINYALSDGTSTVLTLGGTTGSPINFGLYTVGGTYTVSATNGTTACGSNMAGSAVITVASPVTPSVSITAPTGIVCAGTSGLYTAVPVNGGTIPTYQWYVNGVPGAVGPALSYLPNNGDIVSVTLYTGGICALPDTAVASHTAVVTTYSTPGVVISVGPSNPSCLGSPVTFVATPTYGGAAPIYMWTKNGINVATGPTYSYVPASGDVVFCTLTSNYACRTVDNALSSNITVMVQPSAPVPVVNISASPGTNFVAGATVTFTALISGGSGSVTYQWHINGSAIVGATSAVFICSTLANGDIVSCTVTNMDACAKSAVKSVAMSTGTTAVGQTVIGGSNFTLMPNPNNGSFTVHGTTQGTKEVSLKINNVLGQTVYSKNTTANGGILNEQVTMGNVPAGMYILYLNTGSKNELIHFVITN